jgi:hypothetical protein
MPVEHPHSRSETARLLRPVNTASDGRGIPTRRKRRMPLSAAAHADERASRNPPQRPTVVDDVSMHPRAVAILAALCVAGCASHDSSPTTTSDAASAACQQAVPTGHMIGAGATTVQQVRERTGGPGDTSPASTPWRDLPGDQFAAWCTVRVSGHFEVGSATQGAPFVTFMVSEANLGAYPQGPSLP